MGRIVTLGDPCYHAVALVLGFNHVCRGGDMRFKPCMVSALKRSNIQVLFHSDAGRVEEAEAKEEAHQATLLCVNRLWEELNASIGFIQYRYAVQANCCICCPGASAVLHITFHSPSLQP